MTDDGSDHPDDTAPKLSAVLEALPLFPLPGTVFFPHTLLPLHVFAPPPAALTSPPSVAWCTTSACPTDVFTSCCKASPGSR